MPYPPPPSPYWYQSLLVLIPLPYQEVLKPLFDRIPELDQIILKKASEGIIEDFKNLQREIIKILFEEIKFKGVKVIQKEKYFCDPREFPGIPDGGVTGIFKLQINLNTTDMSCEDILKFYHNGMVDYIDFRLEQESSKIEDILEKLGEKFLLIGGNMASKSLKVRIFCKIQATLPQVVKGSYIPARKRIFMEESEKLRNQECATFDFKEIENSEIYKFYQQNLGFEAHFWPQYKLLGEGHFTQIFGTENWKMLLPFSGEGEKLEDDEHIINTEEVFGHQDSNTDYDEEIPETHRDF